MKERGVEKRGSGGEGRGGAGSGEEGNGGDGRGEWKRQGKRRTQLETQGTYIVTVNINHNKRTILPFLDTSNIDFWMILNKKCYNMFNTTGKRTHTTYEHTYIHSRTRLSLHMHIIHSHTVTQPHTATQPHSHTQHHSHTATNSQK